MEDTTAMDRSSEALVSAGGVIFKRSGSIIYVALISVKRGKIWGLPKGLKEEGETLAEAARREVFEETGLNGRVLKKLGHIEFFYTYKDFHLVKKIHKRVYFFLMEFIDGDTVNHDDEVDDARWFPIDEAISLMSYEDEREIIRKAKEILDRAL